MNYIKVAWDHDHAIEPITLYSECDDAKWEMRKVEVFRDGRFGYANSAGSAEGSRLGIEPLPSLEEMACQIEFRPSKITRRKFEQVWSAAQVSFMDVVKV